MTGRRIPSLNWLRVFEAAARNGSFSAAGRELNMSASAISQQMKSLETHLQVTLFRRSGNSTRLTDAGLDFMPTVQRALNSVALAADGLSRKTRTANLNLQLNLIFVTSWLAGRLPRFQEENPDTLVHMRGRYRDDDAETPEADLIVSYGGANSSWGMAEPLMSELVFPVASPQTAARHTSAHDVLFCRLVEIPSHRTGWAAVLAANGVEHAAEARFINVDTTAIALSLAAHCDCIALARSPVSDVMMSSYGLVPCPYFSPVSSDERYYLLYRSRNALSRPARRFRDWLLREADGSKTA